jgi:hypothetical protein
MSKKVEAAIGAARLGNGLRKLVELVPPDPPGWTGTGDSGGWYAPGEIEKVVLGINWGPIRDFQDSLVFRSEGRFHCWGLIRSSD